MSAWDGWAACPRCPARFKGRMQHCPACHQTFAGTAAGDAHTREAEGWACRGPAMLRAGGMWTEPNPKGTPVWHGVWREDGVARRRREDSWR